MDFKNDINDLNPYKSNTISLIGKRLPQERDLYFKAKLDELLNQYRAARVFMRECETSDWNHWISCTGDKTKEEIALLTFKSYFYEASLFYYNSVVDISWVLCYVSASSICKGKTEAVDISKMGTIDEAASELRLAERDVKCTSKYNSFENLKKQCPEFSVPIEKVIEFSMPFLKSEIRKKYNFLKHRGRPYYSEIKAIKPCRPWEIFVEDGKSKIYSELATDITDVTYTFSLNESICELKDFDDNNLFPYLKELIVSIYEQVKPSPYIT